MNMDLYQFSLSSASRMCLLFVLACSPLVRADGFVVTSSVVAAADIYAGDGTIVQSLGPAVNRGRAVLMNAAGDVFIGDDTPADGKYPVWRYPYNGDATWGEAVHYCDVSGRPRVLAMDDKRGILYIAVDNDWKSNVFRCTGPEKRITLYCGVNHEARAILDMEVDPYGKVWISLVSWGYLRFPRDGGSIPELTIKNGGQGKGFAFGSDRNGDGKPELYASINKRASDIGYYDYRTGKQLGTLLSDPEIENFSMTFGPDRNGDGKKDLYIANYNDRIRIYDSDAGDKLGEIAKDTPVITISGAFPKTIIAPKAKPEVEAAATAPKPAIVGDPSLVLHYTFDQDHKTVAKDHSPHGNDGKITGATYLESLDGRKGVMQFDGDDDLLHVPNAKSLVFEGDMTIAMWVRQNGKTDSGWASLFRDTNSAFFDFGVSSQHTLAFYYAKKGSEYSVRRSWDSVGNREQMVLPVKRSTFSEQWAHIAVVVEYPRCRFYHNGELVRDAYMPLEGVTAVTTGRRIGVKCPMDLDEFHLYKRALSQNEVVGLAGMRQTQSAVSHELVAETHWYEKTVTLRLTGKGKQYAGQSVELKFRNKALAPQKIKFQEAFKGSGRYVASAVFPLASLAGQSLVGEARLFTINGKQISTIRCQADLRKPDWVNTQEGYSDEVLAPWAPLTARMLANGDVQVGVWSRRYVFGKTPLIQSIQAAGATLLHSPATITGRIGDKTFDWKNGRVELINSSKTSAVIQQSWSNDQLDFKINTTVDYDGFMAFEYQVTARWDLTIDQLVVKVPMQTQYASLAYGHSVYPWNAKVPIKAFSSGAVKDDQSFKFSPIIWLGDDLRGLCWQAESDEHWYNADEYKAIQILPRGDTTNFLFNLIDMPAKLSAGLSLHYKFALQATPIKPLVRDAWELRVARSEPYGRELDLPDRTIDGKPEAQYLADAGVRYVFSTVCDLWPYPLPVHKRYAKLLHRLNDTIHDAGMKAYGYQIHERFPVMAPEWDIHGLNMSQRPVSQYIPDTTPGDPRPGPVGVDYGADSQGTQYFCTKSMALQDAYIHALAKRIDQYGDDGIYLDGTCRPSGCANALHGCGYRDRNGKIRPTFPAFAVRDFQKRIYTVLKQRKPDSVVDMHASFMYNLPALAYCDLMWTGEQFWHLKKTHGAPGGYVSGELSLERFRCEFTGRQIGIAAETLHYRLGPFTKVAATSLLHDIASRPSTPPMTLKGKLAGRRDKMKVYFDFISKLWKIRDEFGAKDTEKLFYFENEQYVQVAPEKCYSTLLKHKTNGVLAVVSNLSRDKQTVKVHFNLDTLDLRDQKLKVFDVLTDKPVSMSADGEISLPLESEQWAYLWLKP